MKKTLLFIFMLAFVFANAQFTDDIESYPVGPVHQGHWTSWSGNAGAEDGIVSEDIAFSGTKSLLIQEGQGPQDCLLDFGHAAPNGSGQWVCSWKMFIPTGSEGYFNIQGDIALPQGGASNADIEFLSGNITFANGVMADSHADSTVDGLFLHDEWFDFQVDADMDNLTYTFSINGVSVETLAMQETIVSYFDGIDFFASTAANRYYIDDVVFRAATNSITDLESLGFNAYPNPVTNDLFLTANEKITSVSIFNVIGQEVKKFQPNSLSPTIDMSGLDSGAYFVKVNIGSTTGTIKIIK